MLFKIASNRIFRDGMELDCSGRLPPPPEGLEGVTEIRVLPDGAIERYSASDWAWKAAPELKAYVDELHEAYDDQLAAQRAAVAAKAMPVGPA